MDHIQLPTGFTGTRVVVPLLTPVIPYDDLGLKEFARRKGFWKNGRLDEQKTPRELACFVQSWLYFGFLSEVLGYATSPGSFMDASYVDPHLPRLCSASLPDLLDEWQMTLRGLGVTACDRALSAVHKIVEDAIQASLVCDLFIPSVPSDLEQYGQVMLSIKLLIITIIHLYNGLAPEIPFMYTDDRLFPLASPETRPSAAARLLLSHMRNGNICPQAARRMCTSYNFMTAYYLTHLPRHRTTVHSACSKTACEAYKIDQTSYRTAHAEPGCSCHMKPIDVTQVSAFIKDGKTPLIRIEVERSGDVILHVKGVSAGSIGSYIALSHVWHDGLGNPEANSLPLCQLLRLHKMTTPSWSRTSDWFWLDTLCVPVGSDHEEGKRLAISSMASVYQDAAVVLVVDAEIEKLARSLNGREFIAYILSSVWNSRCWTYQEAVLGRKLVFQTFDGRRKPHINDVDFFAQMVDVQRYTTGQSKVRWFLWRLVHHPIQHLVSGLRFVYPLMPLHHILATSFRLSCGPQALQMCRLQRPELRRLLTAAIWLSMSLLVTVLSLPNSCILFLMYWAYLFMISLLYCLVWLYEGYAVMPTKVTLRHEMRLQLATDLVAQLRPTAISSGSQTIDPGLAASQQSRRFAHAWNALVHRTATKPEDLHFILGDLTRISASTLIDLSPLLRMRAIVTSHKRLPLSLLFDPRLASPEFCDPSNTWLPSSPRNHLLSAGERAPCIDLCESRLTIRSNDLPDTYRWLTPGRLEDESEVGFVVDGSSSHERPLRDLKCDPARLAPSTECFLVDTSDLADPGTYRAITLELISRSGSSIHCLFKGPAEIRFMSQYHTRPRFGPQNQVTGVEFHLPVCPCHSNLLMLFQTLSLMLS